MSPAAIKFICPNCQQHLEAPPEMAGDTVECPNCQHPLILPSHSAPVAARPGPPQAQPRDSKKTKVLVVTAGIVGLVALLGGGIYFFHTRSISYCINAVCHQNEDLSREASDRRYSPMYERIITDAFKRGQQDEVTRWMEHSCSKEGIHLLNFKDPELATLYEPYREKVLGIRQATDRLNKSMRELREASKEYEEDSREFFKSQQESEEALERSKKRLKAITGK